MPPPPSDAQPAGVPRYRATLPPSSESARAARAAVEEFLQPAATAGELTDDQLTTVKLLVSELVTNVVLHAGTDCHLQLVYSPDGVVRAEVGDTGPGMPVHREVDLVREDHGGRGLVLLETLASSWEVMPAPSAGKTVSFELRL